MQNPTDDHVIQTTKPRPRTVAALVLGHFIEVYDTALYGLRGPIATAFFPAGNADAALVATLAVFGVSFLSKSAGGLFFGVLADRVGRRNSLMASILLVGGSTAAIGLIPLRDGGAALPDPARRLPASAGLRLGWRGDGGPGVPGRVRLPEAPRIHHLVRRRRGQPGPGRRRHRCDRRPEREREHVQRLRVAVRVLDRRAVGSLRPLPPLRPRRAGDVPEGGSPG